ncbi:hypothetical protein CDD83_2963 [Cordyceps sp. RAO-2017]|nr:hypothetical protein CDD83_2963 [Cordyceps sp. RAO-2017]
MEPYASLGPKYQWKRTTSGQRADAVSLTGEAAVVGRARGGGARPNAVRWTMLENESDRSGVPAFLRTAVLLRRRERDNGQFVGDVRADYRVSPLHDFRQLLVNAVARTRDEPVLFDPKVSTGPSPYDAILNSLDKADIDKEFRLVSFEPKSRAPTDAEEDEPECT